MAPVVSFSDFQKLDPPRLAESRREAGIRKGIITFSDFSRLDIRIGTVVEASVPEWSHWVMKLIVDLGPEIGKKTIFAGIMKFYKPEELVKKQFPFVVNLEPKKMGPMGDFSEGMMIMAVVNDETPVLFKLWKKVGNGTIVR